MTKDFHQLDWDKAVEDDCRQIVLLAVREDLERQHDWTTLALVPRDARGRAAVVVREPGVVAGLPAVRLALSIFDGDVEFTQHTDDGTHVEAGQRIATLEGSARTLLTAERTALNLLGRLCGVATLTARYCAEVAGTKARIYDTRKTTPGWRRLEKYAVGCGGGQNHRTGLFDAVLIKDNHLHGIEAARIAPAVFEMLNKLQSSDNPPKFVEVEADSLDQVEQLLKIVGIDVILLDNFTTDGLVEAVALRERAGLAESVALEASGGVTLDTVAAIAATGVERISVGAITHSATALPMKLERVQ